MSVSVQPLIADVTRMVLSLSTAFVTMSTTFAMFSALATEEPPNFNTCILLTLSQFSIFHNQCILQGRASIFRYLHHPSLMPFRRKTSLFCPNCHVFCSFCLFFGIVRAQIAIFFARSICCPAGTLIFADLTGSICKVAREQRMNP